MKNKSKKISEELTKLLRGDVFDDILHRAAFSTDASIYQITPLGVVAPRDLDDVVAIVKYAAENNIPIAARGSGSGVAGEALCSGIVIDTRSYMNKIISFDNDTKTVTCQPGVVLSDLNDYLADFGRKIGPDPSSGNRAVIGGCLANNATGAHSLQYGYTADYVESVQAVLADGSIAEFKNNFNTDTEPKTKTAEIAKKCFDLLNDKQKAINKVSFKSKRNRCGYSIAGICHDKNIDIAKLMAGSEGTLGIFTEITLKTVPIPPFNGCILFEFESLEKMAQAVPIIVDTGASMCELLDKKLIDMAIDAYPQYSDILPKNAQAVLFIEHTGLSEDEIKAKIKQTDSAVAILASARKIVLDQQEQKRISKARKDAVPLLYRNISKKRPAGFIEDTSVDNSKLAEYITKLQEIAKRYDFSVSYYGHAGDGELHLRPSLDLGDPAEVKKMRAIAEEVYKVVWSLGGSISGEHGNGLVRAAFVRGQYGDEYYEILKSIKNIFDPTGIMNPGKIINPDADIMMKNLRAKHKTLPQRLETDLLIDEEALALEIGQCTGCGLCLSRESDLRMCPVFRAIGDELSTSRAKVNILRFWTTGGLDEKEFESAEFRKFLDLCVNCKACSIQCPSGVDVSKLISTARAQYVKRRRLRRAEFLLSHNRYLSIAANFFSPISNFFMRLGITKWLLEKTFALESKRSMPAFKKGSFINISRKYLASKQPLTEPIDKVAFFVDTYANYNDHELGFAVVDVLRANNIEVILPNQRPAPLPAACYGDVKTARKDLAFNVKHLAEAVRKGCKIICSEPSAALCLKEESSYFVKGEDAKLVSENTFELMTYLLDLFKQGRLKTPAKPIAENFAYHLPCHLLASGDTGATIELLQKLCGVSVIDLSAGCCGLSGTFGMQKKNYELSEQISTQLADALKTSSVKKVLTECSACKMQIEHISDCHAIHPIKILAKAWSIE